MKRRLKGFTLVEMLLVIAVIGILVSLSVPVIYNARKHSRIMVAKQTVNDIEAAVKAYFAEYGRLPVPTDQKDSMEVIKALAGRNESGDDIKNPKGIEFLNLSIRDLLEPGQEWDDWEGRYPDPWGEQYEINMDDDYDGTVEYQGKQIEEIVIVVSKGPDKRGGIWESEFQGDDIKSFSTADEQENN